MPGNKARVRSWKTVAALAIIVSGTVGVYAFGGDPIAFVEGIFNAG
jgi:hypothetical protein